MKLRTSFAVIFVALFLVESSLASFQGVHQQNRENLLDDSAAGFEIGNGREGVDNGGFEIGNGRDVIELINREGAYSVKIYNDFDFEIDGELTRAQGKLAAGSNALLSLGINRDVTIPELGKFLVEGLKNAWSVTKVGEFQALKRDRFDEQSGKYSVDLRLFLTQGNTLDFNLTSKLEGIKEIQAISDSVKVYIN